MEDTDTGSPLSRRWLVGIFAVAVVLCLASSPGLIAPDTKLDLTANPLRFLARAFNLWNSELPFGQAQNQAYGYLFPHGAFFALGHSLGVPGWLTQRLWWAVLLTVGCWGLLRVAEALGIGTRTSRLVGAVAFALSPRVLTTIGSISSEALPMMLAPWVLLPVILALRATDARPLRMLAGRAGVAVALMGAVNAVASLAACLPAIIWWACHRPDQVWRRFTAWWALACGLAVTWWVFALIMLGRISPPFLDFIESSGVTTQWTSLTEVLRGTSAWTPFVAPGSTAASSLVSQPVAVLATTLVAAGGLAGLALRSMPARGRLVTMLMIGLVLVTAGYSGGLGSPLAHEVQAFLDAAGAPLRNVQKLEPVIRLPLVLGVVHLLGRIPLPGSVPRPEWVRAITHPETDKRMAAGIVVLTALLIATSLAWTGRLTPPGGFRVIPSYWYEAADWLTENRDTGRVLVVPGAPFANQIWGNTHDEPLQVLGNFPWGVRDSIPLTPPQTIRALDSVQRLFAAGRGSAGLADTLARQGISYIVVRNDLDPATSRSARPLLVHRAIAGSPGLTKVAEFGEPVGPGTVAGFISDSGLRPLFPAVQIYRVRPVDAVDPGVPYFAAANTMVRVAGGPESLLRIDERRRLLGEAPLGPVLLTADAQRAALLTPPGRGVIVTDTPVDRETDYGRVDDHSSAIRAPGDRRNTFNRVPDYPMPGAPLTQGRWSGGRLSVSSSSSDATALPSVAPASAPVAAVDTDPATAWMSNSLQQALGQWLQIDFDLPVTNATLSITPSATAVGAQVRRLQVATVNGTSTVNFENPGVPLTVALPYGETPWVRITAVGTNDGSSGVQFGITELAVTQYDASGFARPVDLRHTVVVPAPPRGSPVAAWDLGSELLGRGGCADAGGGSVPGGGVPEGSVHCAALMSVAPEEAVTLSRTLTVPTAIDVTPIVWVRARQGPRLADLIAQPGRARATGAADLIDVEGSAFAAADGDPRTSWTAQQGAAQHRSPATLTVTLPGPTEVAGLRLTSSGTALPTHPRMVAVDLGDGPEVRRLSTAPDAGPQTVSLRPRITDTIRISLLDWDDVIDRTALGFDQLKPPGLAEVTALGPDGKSIAAADAAVNRDRAIELPCGQGPVIAVSGRFVQTSVTTTVGALLGDVPIPARACDPAPIELRAGSQELLISPGSAFIADGVQLRGPLGAEITTAPATPAPITGWTADRREINADRSPITRVVVVPESVNPGWSAHTPDDATLTPVIVNGWQQGWVVPAGAHGTITLSFASNGPYRAGLITGLALLPLLLLMALLPARRPVSRYLPARTLSPGIFAAIGLLAAGAMIAGWVGVAVFGLAFGGAWLLRRRAHLLDRVTLIVAPVALILAGGLLSRYPWRSVDGYIGNSAWVQFPALLALAALAVSVLPRAETEATEGRSP